MRLLEQLSFSGWIALWRAMRLYHRYEVQGFEHLTSPGPALIVGYHARGLAVDLSILTVEIYERLGYLPHAVFHESMGRLPLVRDALRGIGGVTGDGPLLTQAVERGEHVIVLPGGGREGCRPAWRRYEVNWGPRTGYLRLALRLGLPLIPVVSSGADELYFGLNDGYAAGKLLGLPMNMPLWVAFGATGIFPMSLPFPVKIRQIVGSRIPLDAVGPVDEHDGDAIMRLHRFTLAQVQALLDLAAGEACSPPTAGRPRRAA